MTQLSGVATTVENQRYTFVIGQIAFQFIEFAVGHTDGTGNVTFVILGSLGS